MTETRVPVGSEGDFAEGSLTPLEVDGTAIVLIRHAGRFYAVPDRCTHAKRPLSDGELVDGSLKCAYHGARFDLETGRPTLPAVKPLKLFEVEVDAGEVVVVMQST